MKHPNDHDRGGRIQEPSCVPRRTRVPGSAWCDESADFTDNQINALVRVDEFWELSAQRFGMHDFHKPVIVSVVPRAREVRSERFEGRLAAGYQNEIVSTLGGPRVVSVLLHTFPIVAQPVAHLPSNSGLLMPKIGTGT